MSEPEEQTAPNDDSPATVDRMLTLTDGVVAIAMTLLVLDIQIPSAFGPSVGDLWRVITDRGSVFIAFFVAFWVIARLWMAHHRMFHLVGVQAEDLMKRNFWFLLTICLVPFTSSLMGTTDRNPLGVVLFSVNLILANLALQWLRWTIHRRGLLRQVPDPREQLAAQARAVTVMVLCALPIALAWVSPSLAEMSFLLVSAAEVPGRALQRRRDARADGAKTRSDSGF